MAGKNPVPWAADQHTKAKHAVYAQYLDKWMPIMVNGWEADITYAEGFSGPGIYLDGSPGSPVIAIKALVAKSEIRTKVKNGGIRFVFIDHDQRCIDMLPNELKKATEPVPLEDLSAHGVHVSVEKGECEPDLQRVLTREQAWGRPILAVLDTWGGAISFDLVRRLADNPGSEVIITMQPQYFARFASVDSIEHGDRVFGDTNWRAVATQPRENKDRWLLQQYRRTIQKAGFQYVLDFELIDKRGQSLFLVFGTTHEKGLTKMKEAMWEVDDVAGVGYRDPRDPNQEALAIEFEPNTAPLKRLIIDHLRTIPDNQSSIAKLRKFALHNTVYKESQAASVVREMVADGQLIRANGRSHDSRLSFTDIVELPA
ncbi:three-Cys-motif partner protein TcmP [Gordonia sp. CPCC 205515]|uniref:three-Cys-motif partner protein TcmP n=1 Tax=Gordonia sp. CPCC 205515 TaxID=3140791 RepID=UPI003AF3C84E